jgi:cytoskeletal protein CcmA (bactofilin family)
MEYSEIPTSKISGSGRLTVPGYGMFKISGSGRISPELIKTSGSSKIPGGLTVGEVKVRGSSTVEGSLITEFMKVSGSSNIEGDLTCEDLEKSGSLRITGALKCKVAQMSGSTKIGNGATVEKELRNSGSIKFGDDVTSDGHIRFSGGFEVQGKLTAKSFEARIGRRESFIQGGIEAEYIEVREHKENWRSEGVLITTDIVGDEVILENVECDNVTGNKVTILPGCRIKGKIQYRESVNVDPKTRIDSEPEKIE